MFFAQRINFESVQPVKGQTTGICHIVYRVIQTRVNASDNNRRLLTLIPPMVGLSAWPSDWAAAVADEVTETPRARWCVITSLSLCLYRSLTCAGQSSTCSRFMTCVSYNCSCDSRLSHVRGDSSELNWLYFYVSEIFPVWAAVCFYVWMACFISPVDDNDVNAPVN